MRTIAYLLALAPLLTLLPACSAPHPAQRCRLWVDVYRGEPIDPDRMVDDLAEARVIYLGERHTVDRHHQLQVQVVKALIAREVPLVLGIEHMEAEYQPALDEYNRGAIDFATLADRTNWKERWSNYADYRTVLEAARSAGAPVIALNARREVVRAVYKSGLDDLDPTLRNELPAEFHLDDPMYREHLRDVMMVHAHVNDAMLDRMFVAQVARDETMAARLVAFLESAEGLKRTAVVLCGSGHCAHGMGIPARVRRRMPGVRDRIIVMSESGDVVLSEREQAMAREIEISHEQLRKLKTPIADYLHVAAPAE